MLKIQPYRPGKPIEEVEREIGVRNCIKLASNENPLGPSPKAVEAVQRKVLDVHRYPDGTGFYLRQKLSEIHGISMESIILGSGTTELIEMVARALLTPRDGCVLSEQSFLMYELAVQAVGARIVRVPLRQYRFDLEAILRALTEETRLVYIANPNNPTGTMVSRQEMDRFLDRVPSHVVVVLDEAYHDYIRRDDYPDGLGYVRQGKNVLVLRTFSKVYGLAGLRIGYGMSQPALIQLLNKVRSPFNANALGQAAALGALGDLEHVARSYDRNQEGMRFLTRGLDQLRVSYVPSVANFLLIDAGLDSQWTFRELLKRRVLVRPMKEYHFPTALRVTVGTGEENQVFLEALEDVLRNRAA
ncbi:MAG: histidinol-phosphate transaminase [Acidobacteria bacterium]|nr:histidinol-phosphate transaminase [Acidobacteriota bacterium]